MPRDEGAGSGLDRRTLLTGAAPLVAGLLAGCADDPASPSEGASTAEPSDNGLESVELTALEPGGATGSITVPRPGEVTLVDLFATWCGPCIEQLGRLRTVHDAVGAQATFVSVTNETFGGTFTAQDLRAWWDDHGGPWTLAHDPEGELFFELEATGVPHTAVVDRTGHVTWSHDGVTDPETVIERIEAAGSDG